jgi:AcrR family transcriptional regulator
MPVRPSSRETLRAAAADYLLENGLADLSLRPLAAAAGTSARMLVYHFGSKEGLIAEAMDEIRSRQRKLAERWIARHPKSSAEKLLDFVWSWVAAPEHEPYLRLFLEILGRGTRKGKLFAEFSRATFEDWVTWAERRATIAGRTPEAARALAVLTVATVRGLAFYYLATKDRRGARAALRALATLTSGQRGG